MIDLKKMKKDLDEKLDSVTISPPVIQDSTAVKQTVLMEPLKEISDVVAFEKVLEDNDSNYELEILFRLNQLTQSTT